MYEVYQDFWGYLHIKMNFLIQDFRQLDRYRQTDRHTHRQMQLTTLPRDIHEWKQWSCNDVRIIKIQTDNMLQCCIIRPSLNYFTRGNLSAVSCTSHSITAIPTWVHWVVGRRTSTHGLYDHPKDVTHSTHWPMTHRSITACCSEKCSEYKRRN